MSSTLLLLLSLLLAPLFSGLIFKIKAFFGGRKLTSVPV